MKTLEETVAHLRDVDALFGVDFSGLTSDELEMVLVTAEAAIARLRLLQTVALRSAEDRQIPAADGCKTLAEWTAGRLDVSINTARTLALLTRSEVVADDGDSIDRVEATTRLAASGAPNADIEFSRSCDIAGVGRLRRHRERVSPTDEQAAHDGRYLVFQPTLDDGTWRIHGRLAGCDGKLVEKVLTDWADTFGAHPDGHRDTRRQRMADALTAICADNNDTEGGDGPGTLVTVHVDASQAGPSRGEAGVWVEAGPRVGVQTLEEILCTGIAEVIAHTEDGTAMTYGRRSRVVPAALRRAVLHRDGQVCTSDGCTSRYRLQPHHMTPYAEGGHTDPDNLTTLCWFHHHVVIHGRGMGIDRNSPPLRRRFRPPRNRPPPDTE